MPLPGAIFYHGIDFTNNLWYRAFNTLFGQTDAFEDRSMWRIFLLILLLISIGFTTAHAEDNFKIDLTPELQGRIEILENRIQSPPTNFGYRTVRLVVQPKQAGDRPVIWAKFFDTNGTLLETIWDRVKVDGRQKIKFDYMDVQVNAVRLELSVGNGG